MGAVLNAIVRVFTLAAKLVLALLHLVWRVIFWITVGLFLRIRGRRRKKQDAERLQQAVDAGRRQAEAPAASAAEQPPPSPYA